MVVLHPEFGRQFLTNVRTFNANFNSKDLINNPGPYQRAHEWTFNMREDFELAIMPFQFYDHEKYGNENHFVLAIYDKSGIYRQEGVIIYDPKKNFLNADHPFRKVLRHAFSTLLPPSHDELKGAIQYSNEKYHTQDQGDFQNSGYFILSYAR